MFLHNYTIVLLVSCYAHQRTEIPHCVVQHWWPTDVRLPLSSSCPSIPTASRQPSLIHCTPPQQMYSLNYNESLQSVSYHLHLSSSMTVASTHSSPATVNPSLLLTKPNSYCYNHQHQMINWMFFCLSASLPQNVVSRTKHALTHVKCPLSLFITITIIIICDA